MPTAPAATAVAVTVSAQVATGRCIYRGLALRETAGATALVRIWDGTGAAGVILDVVALAANQTVSWFLSEGGLRSTLGIYFEKVSGTVEGSVRVG